MNLDFQVLMPSSSKFFAANLYLHLFILLFFFLFSWFVYTFVSIYQFVAYLWHLSARHCCICIAAHALRAATLWLFGAAAALIFIYILTYIIRDKNVSQNYCTFARSSFRNGLCRVCLVCMYLAVHASVHNLHFGFCVDFGIKAYSEMVWSELMHHQHAFTSCSHNQRICHSDLHTEPPNFSEQRQRQRARLFFFWWHLKTHKQSLFRFSGATSRFHCLAGSSVYAFDSAACKICGFKTSILTYA